MNKPRFRSIRLTALGALVLATACHKQPAPPPETGENEAVEAPPAPQAPAPLPPEAPVAPKPRVVEPRPAPEVSADQQVIDDAEAAGMTSHVSRDPAGND